MTSPSELERFRHNAGIDPHLHAWGWEVPVDLFLVATAAGVMVLAAALSLRAEDAERSRPVRWLRFAPLVLLGLAMSALLLDLSKRLHAFRFYTTFEWTSPMSWGSWLLLLTFPTVALWGLVGLTDPELDALRRWGPLRPVAEPLRRLREWALDHARALDRACLGLGLALALYTGVLLGTLGARAAWSTLLLAPLFLASGLASGAALLLLFRLADGEVWRVRRWSLAAIGTQLGVLLLYLVALGTGGGAAGREVMQLFLGGRYTATFWTLVVIVGLAVPLVLQGLEARRGQRSNPLAPVLVLVGAFSLRWILVAVGQL